MFSKKYKRIILVYNEEVCWISNESTETRRQFFRLPLEQVLNQETASLSMPDWVKGGPILCIVPDHWFGCASYPFRSKKPSLIEPFLDRKLSSANPGLKNIRQLYNYRHLVNDRDGELYAIYLQEDNGYRFYDALCKLNIPPQRITSPAFLWEERLEQCDHDFGRLGSLLIHISGQESQLYFYFRGNYQFSRSVMLSDASESLEGLSFEINQSLYMFSQKAKSELDRIYLVCDSPECQARLGESLGREIIDLPALSGQWPDAIKIPGLEQLNGLMQPSQLTSGASFFGIVHRQVKQALEWRPVQLAAIISGLILLLFLAGEDIVLGRMLAEEKTETQSIQQLQGNNDSTKALSEYNDMLEQVLNRAAQSALVEKAYRMPESFTPQMQLRKLELDLESSRTLKLAAIVQARDGQELTLVLTRLIAQIKETFQAAGSFGLDNINISLDRPGDGISPNHYQIDFQLELS